MFHVVHGNHNTARAEVIAYTKFDRSEQQEHMLRFHSIKTEQAHMSTERDLQPVLPFGGF